MMDANADELVSAVLWTDLEKLMITPKQAEQVADSLLDQPRRALDAKREKRGSIERAERARRESPVLPAFLAALTVYIALDYTENAFVGVALGTVVGAVFGWVARR
jgi:hypothetical protein